MGWGIEPVHLDSQLHTFANGFPKNQMMERKSSLLTCATLPDTVFEEIQHFGILHATGCIYYTHLLISIENTSHFIPM